MYILGISAFYHDSAACLINNGEIVSAAQEERFTRKKHDSGFPSNSIKYCIEHAGIKIDDVSNIVFYEKPFLKFERLIETYLAFAPKGFSSFIKAIPLWVKEKLFQKNLIISELNSIFGDENDWKKLLLFSEHHLSHAASAFYPSPFKSAAILTLDGVGEWTTTSLAHGDGNNLTVQKEIHFPHSLGLLYSAFTYFTGFKVNSGEYKVMGLAPYGRPKYTNLIEDNMIFIAQDGSFKLDMSYFNYATGLTMTNKKFHDLFGRAPRNPESPLTQMDMDLAASIQKITEKVVLRLARGIAKKTNETNLCLAGGVALNCVANGILQKERIFKKIWIQPAAGDAGGALGAALAAWHIHHNKGRKILGETDSMQGSYLGPEFNDKEIQKDLELCGAKFTSYSQNEIVDKVSDAIIDGMAVGWMQGRMEFGPRALGSRSILADPRSPQMQKILNLKVKYRESFRPFAPSILSEKVSEWFDLDTYSPYMLLVSNIKEERRYVTSEDKDLFGIDKLNISRSEVPAITHIDYSARIQTVHSETNYLYHLLIKRFEEKTGCPILVNTSFNVRGEPIVCTPTDAFNCFMGTELDILAIGNYILLKEDQDPSLIINYKNKYELD